MESIKIPPHFYGGICGGMLHIFLNIFDIFIYMFDMLIDISTCLLIYIYILGPRGVIWNLVVRASFFHVFFFINSKSHEPDVICSASMLTFSCGSNGMGPDI